MISIATIRNGRGSVRGMHCACIRAGAPLRPKHHAKSPKFSGILPFASNAQCDVKRSRRQRKVSDSLQMRNHSRFLNPIEKRLTGAQYFATQEWHDAVRRTCDSASTDMRRTTAKIFSASATCKTAASWDGAAAGSDNASGAIAIHQRTRRRRAG
ncbi:hypothetical protein [Lysobacter enzymogenes]|uniref:hypothetical protein n=1 Tax=Lysobacter enzymogenes TaxID=69 RepID=UPI001A95CE64|nr:hypothetical protein [Lysobacter enzymogenes]QQP96991.1 hypothetical protein JHW38_02730 [Lysobacter enzymogenes]